MLQVQALAVTGDLPGSPAKHKHALLLFPNGEQPEPAVGHHMVGQPQHRLTQQEAL